MASWPQKHVTVSLLPASRSEGYVSHHNYVMGRIMRYKPCMLQLASEELRESA